MPNSLPLQSCDSLMFVKQNPHRKKKNFIKNETLAQVFSGELCEISKNTSGRLLQYVIGAVCSDKSFSFHVVFGQCFS